MYVHTCRPFGYEKVYLTLYKVEDTPFHIQKDDVLLIYWCSPCDWFGEIPESGVVVVDPEFVSWIIRWWQCCSILSSTTSRASRDNRCVVNNPETGKAFWKSNIHIYIITVQVTVSMCNFNILSCSAGAIKTSNSSNSWAHRDTKSEQMEQKRWR